MSSNRNLKSNPPKIGATFSKLPASVDASNAALVLVAPPRARGGGMDFLAEELRDIYNSRAKAPYTSGQLAASDAAPKGDTGSRREAVDADEWKRFNEERAATEDGLHQSLTTTAS
jgi:hypothetical protein